MLPEVPSDNWKDKYFQMKQIKIMVAFAFLSVVLSAGCKKDSKSDITPDAMVITTSINYKLMTEPQNPSSFLIWNSGYITTSALTFNGTHTVGNSVRLAQFKTSKVQTVSLLNTTNLGTVGVVASAYDDISFTATLNANLMAHALFLTGIYNAKDQNVPVQLIIDGQVLLSSVWLQKVTVYPSAYYLTTLLFDLGQVTNGITANSLDGAVRTSGQIIISNEFNQDLYNLILGNLTNEMKVRFGIMPVSSPYIAPVSAPPTTY